MYYKDRYRRSQILFGGSLLLLAAFLAFWLEEVYSDTKEELDSKIGYEWLSIMRESEREQILETVGNLATQFDSVKQAAEADTATNSYTISFSLGYDTEGGVYERKEVEQLEEEQLAAQKGAWIGDALITQAQEIPSALFEAAINERVEAYQSIDYFDAEGSLLDSLVPDSVIRQNLGFLAGMVMDVQFFTGNQALEDSLTQQLKERGLGVDFELVAISDSVPTDVQHTFKQSITNNRYGLRIADYQGLIWKEIWGEVLIALLLWLILAAAFFYILRSFKKQSELIAIKNELMANITHELRTPIFTVSAALEALQSFDALKDPEKTKEYLRMSQSEVQRLSLLVEKVLKTSLFDQKMAPLDKESVNLKGLLQSIQQSLQLVLEKREAILDVDCPPVQLQADKVHLSNALYNLIDNAIKYSPEQPQVEVSVEEREDHICIAVKDQGMGIPKAYQKQLFERFFRVPSNNVHDVKGFGLGLNYVAGVMRKHGGRIEVESHEGEGSTFRLFFPKTENA